MTVIRIFAVPAEFADRLRQTISEEPGTVKWWHWTQDGWFAVAFINPTTTSISERLLAWHQEGIAIHQMVGDDGGLPTGRHRAMTFMPGGELLYEPWNYAATHHIELMEMLDMMLCKYGGTEKWFRYVKALFARILEKDYHADQVHLGKLWVAYNIIFGEDNGA